MQVVEASIKLALAAAAICALAWPAQSKEKVSYQYDQHGRLVKVTRAKQHADGTPDGPPRVTDYTYDKADNRQKVKLVGTSSTGGNP